MKLAMFSNIFAALAFSGFALAQDGDNGFGPFFLQLQSINYYLNGRYLYACHAGAAIHALCVNMIDTAKPASHNGSYTFYFNPKGFDNTEYHSPGLGTLTWNMPVSGGRAAVARDFSLPLSLNNVTQSNIAVAVFQVGASKPTGIRWDNDVMYIRNVLGSQMRDWYSCYQKVGSYDYDLLAWSNGGEPKNPTCRRVDVIKVSA